MGRVLLALIAAVMMVAMVSRADGSNDDDADGADDAARHDEGASGDVTADADELGRAVEATGAVERARVELQTVYTGLARLRDVPAGVDDVRLIQRAAFDRSAGRVRAESDMSELAAVLETADEAVPGDYSLPTRFVIDGDTVYAQIGPMARAIGLEPTSWIKRDLVGFAEQSIDNETAALLLDPLGMLGLLARPVTAVRSVGYDHVRGAATTHLTATVDLRARSSSAPAPSSAPSTNGSSPSGAGGDHGDDDAGDDHPAVREAAPEAELDARFRAIGVDELPVDVYIDADHIIRRLEFRLDAPGSGGGGSGAAGQGALTTTFDVYDVGDQIDIALPASADVIDQADLQSRLDP
jgi:hypothetical protein